MTASARSRLPQGSPQPPGPRACSGSRVARSQSLAAWLRNSGSMVVTMPMRAWCWREASRRWRQGQQAVRPHLGHAQHQGRQPVLPPVGGAGDHMLSRSPFPANPMPFRRSNWPKRCGHLAVLQLAATSVENAVIGRAASHGPASRVLICGSLYLAGHVLAAEEQTRNVGRQRRGAPLSRIRSTVRSSSAAGSSGQHPPWWRRPCHP